MLLRRSLHRVGIVLPQLAGVGDLHCVEDQTTPLLQRALFACPGTCSRLVSPVFVYFVWSP